MARQYKLARKMKGIALTAAVKALGVMQPTLSGWESERKTPSIEGLIRMAKFYEVTTDFLLRLTAGSEPRPDWLQPIAPEILSVLHETPVYVPEKGWAFVDAADRQLRLANGDLLSFSDVNSAYLLPLGRGLGGTDFLGYLSSGTAARVVPGERALCRKRNRTAVSSDGNRPTFVGHPFSGR